MSSENKDKDSAHLEELRKRAKWRDQGLNVGIATILRMRGLLKEEQPSALVAGTSPASTENAGSKAAEAAKTAALEAAGEKKEKEPEKGRK